MADSYREFVDRVFKEIEQKGLLEKQNERELELVISEVFAMPIEEARAWILQKRKQPGLLT